MARRCPDFYTMLTKEEAEEAVILAEAVKKEVMLIFNQEDFNQLKK